VDEARNGVRVNAISPGNIVTSMFVDWADSHADPQAVRDYVDSWQWIGRMGTPEEVAYACLFLASNGASFVTGIDLPVTGGAELAYGVKWPRGGRMQL
jgi:NAD(P)-dependent dehydrogenase (short-subunit alcohol dehydrogenase family)